MLVKQKNKNMKFNTNVYFFILLEKTHYLCSPTAENARWPDRKVERRSEDQTFKQKIKKKTNIILVTLIVDGRGGHEFVVLLLLQFVRVEFQRRHHGGRVFLLVRLAEQFILIKKIFFENL